MRPPSSQNKVERIASNNAFGCVPTFCEVKAMNFTHYDLGQLSRGDVVEVLLADNAANVRLMDGSNFSNYKNGRQHRYIGGLAKSSPTRLQVDNPGHWHVTVDMAGLRGTVRSSIRVIHGS